MVSTLQGDDTAARHIEKQLGDRIEFYSANVEHCMLITQRYKVNQIPALLAIDKGVVTAQRTGSGSKAEILQWIKTALPDREREGQ